MKFFTKLFYSCLCISLFSYAMKESDSEGFKYSGITTALQRIGLYRDVAQQLSSHLSLSKDQIKEFAKNIPIRWHVGESFRLATKLNKEFVDGANVHSLATFDPGWQLAFSFCISKDLTSVSIPKRKSKLKKFAVVENKKNTCFGVKHHSALFLSMALDLQINADNEKEYFLFSVYICRGANRAHNLFVLNNDYVIINEHFLFTKKLKYDSFLAVIDLRLFKRCIQQLRESYKLNQNLFLQAIAKAQDAKERIKLTSVGAKILATFDSALQELLKKHV